MIAILMAHEIEGEAFGRREFNTLYNNYHHFAIGIYDGMANCGGGQWGRPYMLAMAYETHETQIRRRQVQSIQQLSSLPLPPLRSF